MRERYLVGLDLGSSRIRLAVGQVIVTPDKRSYLNIVGGAEAPSAGISKGAVTSLEDAVSSISACLQKAERIIGIPISEAAVGIGGAGITSQEAKGVVGVSRSDGEIREEDLRRALESARAYVNPANQEILHVLPRGYSVDGQSGIKDPLGMQGIRLEVDSVIVQGLSSHVRNLTKAVFRTGLDVSLLVYAPLAAAESVTTARQRELGVCVLNIGAATTGMAVYENGELLRAVTFPIGADHITSDIAIGLRVSIEAAEQVKLTYGTADPEQIQRKGDTIDLMDFGASQHEAMPLRYVAEIIEARAEEIFEKVEAELKRIDRQGLLPAGVVLTGGGAKLPGMVEVGKRVLRLPCAVGIGSLPSSIPEIIQDSSFSTSVGLVEWWFESEKGGESYAHGVPPSKGGEFLSKLTSPLKKIFKSFIP